MHVILWDVPPEQFVAAFDPHVRERFTDKHFLLQFFVMSLNVILQIM